MKRLLGLDYGTRRIGVALSDPLGISAQPLEVIKRAELKEDVERLRAIVREHGVSKIILGLPLNMDGTPGTLGDEVRGFGQKLRDELSIEVEFFDERLSTLQTERILIEEADMSREKRKVVRDKIAAALVLQAYLDSHRI